MYELCRSSGFEPTVSSQAFHSAGDTGTIASARSVALAPESVRGGVPGTTAVLVAGDDVGFDTYLVWEPETLSAPAARFRELAVSAFGYLTSK